MNNRQAGRALYSRYVHARLALLAAQGERRRCPLCRLVDWWKRRMA